MKAWQFWLLFIAMVSISGQLANVSHQLACVGEQSKESFNQTRWMTWKMDQGGSDRIEVDTDAKPDERGFSTP